MPLADGLAATKAFYRRHLAEYIGEPARGPERV
jgi:hypothetical protein